MALKANMTPQLAVFASLPSTLISSGSRSMKMMPLGGLRKPLRCTRRRRAGIARASDMAEPESAGAGKSPPSTATHLY